MRSHDSRQRGHPREGRYYSDLYLVAPSILGKLAIVQVRTWKTDTKS